MARQDRIAELISLLDYAISTGNDDLAQEVRSDIFRETKGTLQMNHGGIANIENMTAPIGMAGGGDWKIKLLGSKSDNATLNAMRDHPFQTALYLDLGFDKMFDLLSMLPMMKDGGAVGMNDGGLHPLTRFKEIWEAYKLDGGELEFKPYFDMLQEELTLMDYDED
tara:strand:+ start:737 stop:1234 length:498 start_codon:yes stop_codon:yes gene_type:complete